MAFRVGIFVLYIAVTFGWTFLVTSRALLPAWARPRARGLRVAAVALTIVVTAIEITGRRYAPLGGGLWRTPVMVERILLLVLWCVTISAGLARVLHRIRTGSHNDPIPAEPDALSRREAMSRALAVTTVAATTPTFMIGSRARHDLQVTDVTVTIPDLPPSLEGITLVQLTDLHAGIFTGAKELDHLAEVVRRLRGDLVVLTGDILDNNPKVIPDTMRALARLRGRMGVYAVLGNHDHYTGPTRVARGLSAVGVTVLRNGAVAVHGGDPSRGTITLAGVDDVMAPRIGTGDGPDLRRALRGVNLEAPVVLLAHNPVYFHESAGRVALQVSGHTHGGQIDLGPVTRAAMPFVAGRYDAHGSALFVSRGVGITGPPVRLGAAPEVVRIALTSRRRSV